MLFSIFYHRDKGDGIIHIDGNKGRITS